MQIKFAKQWGWDFCALFTENQIGRAIMITTKIYMGKNMASQKYIWKVQSTQGVSASQSLPS